MRIYSAVRLASLYGTLAVSAAPALGAQTEGFDASYGFWWTEEATALVFSAGYHHRLAGPLGYSIGFTHLDDNRSSADRTLSGAEVGLTLGRDGSGPFLVGNLGAGFLHGGGDFDATWSAGGGYLFRAFGGLSLGVEARYRVEDPGFAGFWRLDPADRRGLAVQGRLTIPLGRSRRTRPPVRSGPGGNGASGPREAPPADEITELARNRGASDDAARLTTNVIETALAVMGTPYEWGGSDENGFDCSGLIQYAYGQHGVILPRVSRDQMRMGQPVDRDLAALRPGDLLGFSVEGTSYITHIGLYVGDGQFIHSASAGVKLSGLDASDGESRWWRQRWVAVRRVID